MSKYNTTKVQKCKDCGTDKPCSEFHHLGGVRNNIARYCLSCHENRLAIEPNRIELFSKGLKICVKCNETKELYMFYNAKAGYDGKNCYCKPCSRIVNSQYPVNPELKKANKQRYRFKNREFINTRQIEVRKLNKFRFMAHTANRRAKQIGQTEKVTQKQLWSLAKKQKLKCALSGKKLTNDNISLDHIIPLCRGGKNLIENLQFVDNSVNLMKGSYLPDDFLEAIKAIYSHSILKHE